VIASSTASLGTESTNIPRVTWTGFSNTAAATTADHTSHSSHTRHATPMSSTNSNEEPSVSRTGDFGFLRDVVLFEPCQLDFIGSHISQCRVKPDLVIP
jgi:hypothetical protein